MHPALRYSLMLAVSLVLVYLGSITAKDHHNQLELIQQRRVVVDGRWKTVRKSLGLTPIPPHASPGLLSKHPVPHAKLRFDMDVSSRFNLRQKRAIDTLEAQLPKPSNEPPTLYFTEEALEQPLISYDAFMDSLRRAVAEKANTPTTANGGPKPRLKGNSASRNGEKKRRAARWIKRDD